MASFSHSARCTHPPNIQSIFTVCYGLLRFPLLQMTRHKRKQKLHNAKMEGHWSRPWATPATSWPTAPSLLGTNLRRLALDSCRLAYSRPAKPRSGADVYAVSSCSSPRCPAGLSNLRPSQRPPTASFACTPTPNAGLTTGAAQPTSTPSQTQASYTPVSRIAQIPE